MFEMQGVFGSVVALVPRGKCVGEAKKGEGTNLSWRLIGSLLSSVPPTNPQTRARNQPCRACVAAGLKKYAPLVLKCRIMVAERRLFVPTSGVYFPGVHQISPAYALQSVAFHTNCYAHKRPETYYPRPAFSPLHLLIYFLLTHRLLQGNHPRHVLRASEGERRRRKARRQRSAARGRQRARALA